jgi:hypothetical protein
MAIMVKMNQELPMKTQLINGKISEMKIIDIVEARKNPEQNPKLSPDGKISEMKIIDIVEARKNPEQNPKLSPDEQLAQLVERYGDDLFVRLSGIPKFGAHPTAFYNTTPLGLYAYPASYALDGINELPYPEPTSPNSRYVIIFKIMPNAVEWNLGEDDPDILKRVQSACSSLIKEDDDREKFNRLLAEPNPTPEARDFKTIRAYFLSGDDYDTTRSNEQLFEYALDHELADSVESMWQKEFDAKWQKLRAHAIEKLLPGILEERGYTIPSPEADKLIKDAISDPDNVYSNKVYEAYADDQWSWMQGSDLENQWLRSRNIFTMKDFANKYTSLVLPKDTSTDINNSAGLWTWIKTTQLIHKSTPIRFRTILLKAGIDAAFDPGLSIIHPNEPTQAVFFTSNKVKQVGLIDKRRTGNPMRSNERGLPMPDTTRAQYLTAIKNNTIALSHVPLVFKDYQMCLTAVKKQVARVSDIPTTLEPNQYNELIHKVVTSKPYEVQTIKRGSIPEVDYVALWKYAIIENHNLWRPAPDDVKDIIMPGWNAPHEEVNRVKELAERLLR